MNIKLRLIFVGRLEKEKWFHLILDMCERFSLEEQLVIHLDIFGDGSLKERLLLLTGKYSFITYHGHQPKDVIKDIWQKSHYTLMPSLFLETFWLSALDSLSLGVPIIAPSKWGLAQFTSDDYRIEHADHLLNIIRQKRELFSDTSRKKESKHAVEVSRTYSKQKWLERFFALSGLEKWARILLVSDFIIDIGGIEHYLLEISWLLENAGYHVRLVGCRDEYVAKHRFSQLRKTIRNEEWARLFSKAEDDFTPDLIRWHSIQRRWWPLVLRRARHVRATQWIMYHDFGLFHPYPSCVYSREQVRNSNSFIWYLQEWFRVCRMHVLLHIAKWCSRTLLMSHLEQIIDLHLVPSDFMKEEVQTHFHKPISISTLSHF